MTFLSRLFGTQADPKEALRPLWHSVVSEAREPEWYRACGAADTVDGRFDMITSITAMVMLRMEKSPELLSGSARLTELFAQDMDAQLRETGLGDPTLGKKMGKLMEALGGRIGALRESLPEGIAATTDVVERNSRLNEGVSPEPMARRLLALEARLEAVSDEELSAGRLSQ